MYNRSSSLIFGFHGCDESVAIEVVNSKTTLKDSNNSYDWLGHGIYFWENSPSRALAFAEHLAANPGKAVKPITKPAVLGAIIDLGFCLDLVDYENLKLLASSFEVFKSAWENEGKTLPDNRIAGEDKDLLLRELDCAIIETLHNIRQKEELEYFDSVRGVFFEGKDLYPNAGLKEKNHIQLCIRSPNCIKGYFLPRAIHRKFNQV